MKMKKILCLLLAAVTAVSFCACKKNVGTPEDNPVVEETEDENETTGQQGVLFGYICPDLSDPFYEVLKDTISVDVEEAGGRLMVRESEQDEDGQELQIRELAEEGVSAVFLCPLTASSDLKALETLDELDIPVIDLNVMAADADLIDAFIGFDNYNAGSLCGEDLKEKKPDGGNIVIVERPSDSAISERITGFEEEIVNSGFEVVKRISSDEDGGIRTQMEEILAQNPDIDAVMCGHDRLALEVLDVLDTVDDSSILVYSVGGFPEIKSRIAEPGSRMAGVSAVSPINMGKEAVKTAEAMLNGDDFEEEISVETFFINQENIEIYGTDGWQ